MNSLTTDVDGEQSWPTWDGVTADKLVRYVASPKELETLLPHLSATGSIDERVADLYERLAGFEITYTYETAGVSRSAQWIRSPRSMLCETKAGTCLDLAILFASGCLASRLHPVLVIAERDDKLRHAFVAIRRDVPEWELNNTPVRSNLTTVESLGSGRGFIAVDVVGFACRHAHGQLSLTQAINDGTNLIGSPEWDVLSVTDVGALFAPEKVFVAPGAVRPGVLESPFVGREEAASAAGLSLLQAKFRIWDYVQDRLTWDQQYSWCVGKTAGDVGVSTIVGAGGAGKTRFALEIADQLGVERWCARRVTSAVTRSDYPQIVAWVRDQTANMILVIDYADALTELVERVTRAMMERAQLGDNWRGRLLLTIRDTAEADGSVRTAIGRAELAGELHRTPIKPASNSELNDVYLRAASGLSAAQGIDPTGVGPRNDWANGAGALDAVMLAWLTVTSKREQPPLTRKELLEAVVARECDYWRQVFKRKNPSLKNPRRAAWLEAGALVTMISPTASQTSEVLAQLPGIGSEWNVREAVAEVFNACLTKGNLMIQPDPIADYLIAEQHTAEPRLRVWAMEAAFEIGALHRLYATLSRVGGSSLISLFSQEHHNFRSLRSKHPTHRPARPRNSPIVDDQSAHAESAASSRTRKTKESSRKTRTEARKGGESQPLQGASAPQESAGEKPVFAGKTPMRHATSEIRHTAQTAKDAASSILVSGGRDDAGTSTGNPQIKGAAEAQHLLSQARDLRALGRPDDALAAATMSVGLLRKLARENPTVANRDLALSLAAQAFRLADAGMHTEAVAAAREGQVLYRGLVVTSPIQFDVAVAKLFTVLPTVFEIAGGARPRIDSPPTRRQPIPTAKPPQKPTAARSPSADNLEKHPTVSKPKPPQVKPNPRNPKLDTAAELVQRCRALAARDPTRPDPKLAHALLDQAVALSASGHNTPAINAAIESVELFRKLVDLEPSRFDLDLASALKCKASLLGDIGQERLANTARAEARRLERTGPAKPRTIGKQGQSAPQRVGEDNPTADEATQSNLAQLHRLNTITHQMEPNTEDRDAAVERSEEGTQTPTWNESQALAEQYLLQAEGLAKNGDKEGALRASGQSVFLYRSLAATKPDAYNHCLAEALLSHCSRLRDMGRAADELEASEESLALYRQLAYSKPEAFGTVFALSLLLHAQREIGMENPRGALKTITDCLRAFRILPPEKLAEYGKHIETARGLHADLIAQLSDDRDDLPSIAKTNDPLGRQPEAKSDTRPQPTDRTINTLERTSDTQPNMGSHPERPGVPLAKTHAGGRPQTQTEQQKAQSPHGKETPRGDAMGANERLSTFHQASESDIGTPDTHDPGPAIKDAERMHSESLRQARNGRIEEAVRCALNSVDLYGKAAKSDFRKYGEPLLIALLNLEDLALQAGLKEEACTTGVKAIQIAKGLMIDDPRRIRSLILQALHSLSYSQVVAGHFSEAIETADERVSVARMATMGDHITAQDHQRLREELARALSFQASLSLQTGSTEKALASSLETIRLLESLAAQENTEAKPDLAGELENLAAIRDALGEPQAALDAATRSVHLYRELNAGDGGEFDALLARAIEGRAFLLAKAGRTTEATQAQGEAEFLRSRLG